MLHDIAALSKDNEALRAALAEAEQRGREQAAKVVRAQARGQIASDFIETLTAQLRQERERALRWTEENPRNTRLIVKDGKIDTEESVDAYVARGHQALEGGEG